MDNVYEAYLKTFSYQSQEVNNKIMKFSDFFSLDYDDISHINDSTINITSLTNGKFFVSNCKTKGFFLDKNSKIETIDSISVEYRKMQRKIGKITDLFNFDNRYFMNIIEIFSDGEYSNSLGEFTSEFLKRNRDMRTAGNINIDEIFTIAYEGNGNRIVLTKDNSVYIYAHDLQTRYYEQINEMPKNTFFAIPKIHSFNDFVKAFFEDFVK